MISKQYIIAIVGVLIITGVAVWALMAPPSPPTGINNAFSQEGVLTKETAAGGVTVWKLAYPGGTKELTMGQMDLSGIESGMRVLVKGIEQDGKVIVSSIGIVSANKDDLIWVSTPLPNQIVQSPLTITGFARGNWYFEASFPIKLLDGNGKVLVQTFAQAQGEWMTTNYVPFSKTLTFEAPTTADGTLVLEKDNPSGLPENDNSLIIPVKFNVATQAVKLYYYDANKDKDASGNILCSRQGLVAVERQMPVSQTPIQDAIKLLLQGQLTTAEKAQGISTEYPLPGVALKGANLKNGTLTLEILDPQNKTGGGSCRVGILWFQIEKTAQQFPGVSTVKFIPEYLFQP